MKMKYKTDKGVAGLTILLSLIVMLFVIGLLVMIFSIMGSKLQDNSYDRTTGHSNNESLTVANKTGVLLVTGNNAYRGQCGAVTKILNGTTDLTGNNVSIGLGNITQVGCRVYNNTDWLAKYGTALTGQVRYTYTYTQDSPNTATDTINETTSSISSVTDWFSIFITIGAMVVLILLTVIIIVAIRSSGMVGGDTGTPQNVGSA